MTFNINAVENPCKQCTTERYVGCHGKCEKYLSWRAEYKERSSIVYQERQKHFLLENHEKDAARKRRKRSGR